MRLFRTAVLLVIVLAAFVAASTAGAAGNGSVSIVPASSNVVQGGTVDIDVVIDPPASGTSIWIIQFPYDPNVVRVLTCNPMTSPGGGIAQASSCDTKDTNGDTVDDTAVAFGGWVENDGGVARGFETPQRAATFTFQAVGPPGSQSLLHVIVTALLGPNGEVGAPATNDGVIHVVVSPVGGTVEMVSGAEPGERSTWAVALAAFAIAIAAGVASALRRVRR